MLTFILLQRSRNISPVKGTFIIDENSEELQKAYFQPYVSLTGIFDRKYHLQLLRLIMGRKLLTPNLFHTILVIRKCQRI